MKTMKISMPKMVVGATVICGILAIAFIAMLPNRNEPLASPSDFVTKERVHTDHGNMIFGPFESGSDVTVACLNCHPEAAKDLMHTQHWEWLGKEVMVPGHDKPMRIGKKNLINNFCIGIENNNSKCVSCHAGYGWEDNSFDFSDTSKMDCLVCHDQSGQYAKGENGYPKKGVDLVAAAKSVSTPGRSNCGTCHFSGGGGNGVKHGDLDGSLSYPTKRIDVHMGKLDFTCIDCHKTEKHQIPGRSMGVSVDNNNRVECTDCHQGVVHHDDRIDAHTGSIACQTCHIPEYAVDDPTKMWWDWSTAGQDLDIKDPHKYLKIKGSFRYKKNVVPDYYWYNGESDRYIVGDKINPGETTYLNFPHGNIHDSTAKITPFKIHRGKQVYDKVNNIFLVPTTAGKGGFWHEFDWPKALELGAEATGIPFSGEYGFAPTGMFWKLSHMVAPKEKALRCNDCHGNEGRMDWKRLGYEGDPIIRGDRKRLGLIDETKTCKNGGVSHAQR